MIVEHTGLQTSALTWYLAIGLLVFWALSLPLLVRIRAGWEQVFMNLLGLVWMGFGVGIVIRFFVLTYDAEAFASPSTELVNRLPDVVNLALMNAGLYWICIVGAVVAARLVPIPALLVNGVRRPEDVARRALVPIAVVSAVCLVISLVPGTPASLVTPFSLLGSMWVIPATIVWVDFFRGKDVSRVTLAIALAPGALRAVLSPYREHLLVIALVMIVAAVFAGRRLRLAVVVPVAIVLALLSTIVITTYRQITWMQITPDDALAHVSLSQWEDQPFDAPWTEIMRRFHDFDSLLLTVDLVPDVLPFSDRNMLTEGVTRGLVPRVLDPTKRASDEGLQFQTLIWSYDDDPTREVGTASIAPSMPGSLYEAGGMTEVAAGALLWGLLIAVVERFKSRIPSPMSAGLHVLWATQALASVEHDYAAAFANLIQTLVMLFCVCIVLGRLGRSPEVSSSGAAAPAIQ